MQLQRRTFLRLSGTVLGSALLPAALSRAAGPTLPKPSRPPMPGMLRDLSGLVSVADFESQARERLSHMAYEYIAGGAGDEITVRWNREALDAIRLNPRVLINTDPVDTSVKLWDQTLTIPLLLAPTAFHRLAHPLGEVETARGADLGKVPFVVSSLSTRRLEHIAKETTHPLWLQFFILQKARRAYVKDLLQEAKQHGIKALVITVDAPVTGARNRSERARFRLPDHFETPYYPDRAGRNQSGGLPISGPLVWSDVEWLRSETQLPVVLKGILNPADATQAVQMGVDGIIVSNHGGRELDTVPASISALPPIVQAVENRIPVLMDSGIRRGTDIMKALALGARAVLIGRPYLYGLATGGAEGVHRVVDILRREFEMGLALIGKQKASELDPSILFHS